MLTGSNPGFNQKYIDMMKYLLIGCLFVLFLASPGCKPKYRQNETTPVATYPDDESILRSNQLIIRKNAQIIRDRATARGWILTETGTGIFYQIQGNKKSHDSEKIRPMDRVSLAYNLTLLDGTPCYTSEMQGPKQFVVEKSEAESGLHEAVQYMHPGDSALVIIPPHRAFGLSGDGNRIPPGAILVYEIRIDSVARYQTQ